MNTDYTFVKLDDDLKQLYEHPEAADYLQAQTIHRRIKILQVQALREIIRELSLLKIP